MESSRRGVKGVVLDAAIFDRGGRNKPHLDKLLHRLLHSRIHLGILFRNSNDKHSSTLSKEIIENYIPLGYSFDARHSNDDCLGEVLKNFTIAWNLPTAQCVFATLVLEEFMKVNLINQGWHVCLPPVDGTDAKELSVDRMPTYVQELYSHIMRINKTLIPGVIVVGHTMKWSREMDFLKRGALPLNVIENNLSFIPVNLELPLDRQFKILDVMLHKPTDEISSISFEAAAGLDDQIKFTDAMQTSIRYLNNNPHICVIDPVERILPLLDRALTQEVLQGLTELELTMSGNIRGPQYQRVLRFSDLDCLEELKHFPLPAIVKPQMACGVSDAHTMAIVFKPEGFLNLAVPNPSTVQEYIDHGSKLYKFYVIGEEVFYSVRSSTPNAMELTRSPMDPNVPAAIIFDSLKSLPKQFIEDDKSLHGSPLPPFEAGSLNLDLVHAAANWLRRQLKITIFGFDVVIQVNNNDHVIVDINFLPTFKDVDERRAIPAFWNALARAYTQHNERNEY